MVHSSAVFCRRSAVILMPSSTGTPAARGSSVGSFRSSRVSWALYQVMRFSQRAVYTYYYIHILTETKKNYVRHFCG